MTKIPYYILIALTILLVCIYIMHNRKELFSVISSNNPIVNLPGSDIHFINDNNPTLIDASVFNYKLMNNLDNKKTNTPTPSNTFKTVSEKFESISNSNTHSNTHSNTNTKTNPNKDTTGKNTNDKETRNIKYLSVFQHKPFDTYKGIGQFVILTDNPFSDITSAVNTVLNKRCLNFLTSSPIAPVSYDLVWTSDLNQDGAIFSVWHPIPPAGCATLGDVIVMGTDQPSKNLIACYPITMLEKAALSNGIIWKSMNDMGKLCYCWGAGNIDTFRASNIYSSDMTELQSVYNLPLTTLGSNTLGNNASSVDQSSSENNTLENIINSKSGGITI